MEKIGIDVHKASDTAETKGRVRQTCRAEGREGVAKAAHATAITEVGARAFKAEELLLAIDVCFAARKEAAGRFFSTGLQTAAE